MKGAFAARRYASKVFEENLSAARILVVEDEALIAMDIQFLLEEAGYMVLGPVSTVPKALQLLESSTPDFCLLDVNLGSTDAIPLADELATRGINFLFLSGHSTRRLPEEHRHRTLISKPFLPSTILEAVRKAVETH